MLVRLGRYKEAIELLEKVIEKGPEDSDAWLFKSIALRSLSRYEEAIDAFIKAIEMDPENALCYTFKFYGGDIEWPVKGIRS